MRSLLRFQLFNFSPDNLSGEEVFGGTKRDVMKMMDQGKSLKEMRAQIEKAYSKYGPPTPTPPVS